MAEAVLKPIEAMTIDELREEVRHSRVSLIIQLVKASQEVEITREQAEELRPLMEAAINLAVRRATKGGGGE